MVRFPWPKRAVRLIGAALSIWMVAAFAIALDGLCTRPANADLALVMGNTVTRANRPTPRLEARLEAARALYSRGGCKAIMVSGGIDERDLRNEAAGMRQWLVEHGVPPGAIVEDSLGTNTRASAQHARRWLLVHHMHSAVVISQYFHLPRARLALRQEGVIDAGGQYPRRWFARDLYSSLREVPGYLAYWMKLDEWRANVSPNEATAGDR